MAMDGIVVIGEGEKDEAPNRLCGRCSRGPRSKVALNIITVPAKQIPSLLVSLVGSER